MPQWLVVGISGVTCGGKTTLAQNLRDYFKNLRGSPLWHTPYNIGEVQLISQDDYFLPVDDLRHKWHEKLNAINFEVLTSLDMKQMLTNIAWIIKGHYLPTEPTPTNDNNLNYMHDTTMSMTPAYTYNFEHYAMQFQQQHYQQQQQTNVNYPNYQQQQQHNQQRHASNSAAASANTAHIMRVNAQHNAHIRDKKINILIIEGFLIFNQSELLELCHLKFHFHLPYEKCYERRRKRTYDPPDVTGYFEMCVWPYYELNFAEYRDHKDITFLNGEMCKEKIFKFVLQRILRYFDERLDNTCPPPQKLIGMLGTTVQNGGTSNASNGYNMTKACPMEQQ